MRQHNLNLWPIGNCQVSALVDDAAGMVWGCQPQVDGDPLFCSLLEPKGEGRPGMPRGEWRFVLEKQVSAEPRYDGNSPILVTRLTDADGGAVDVYDFCPRFMQSGRPYRPVAFARIVRPVTGGPRLSVRLNPATHWGAEDADRTRGSNHVRYLTAPAPLRVSTDAPVGRVLDGRPFRVERDLAFFLGADESFSGAIGPTVARMMDKTKRHWMRWVRGLAIPLDWQDIVIRCAIALKLCQHEETGAIVAALTTSIPEAPGSQRNWDYRYCWIRDAYYTVQALNRLGALDVLEGYLYYLRDLVDGAEGEEIQPLYGVAGNSRLDEGIAEALAGYRGMGPVRIGNAAFTQAQHDAYGQIVLSNAQAFFDQRLFRSGDENDFHQLEAIGEMAVEKFDRPDAGLWEFRTRASVHTYSSVMCWAACDRLANIAERLGLSDRQRYWTDHARQIRAVIEERAWNEDKGRFSAIFDGDELDASLLQLVDMRFLPADDPRFRATLEAVEEGLRHGDQMLRYASEDDFGLPETAFNFCTFWLIEALHRVGRDAEARDLFEATLERLTPACLLSEDTDVKTGELWGNYPQTYSLVGLINCAGLLSRPWSSVR
ncbi:glycoside hydrolase family 15 protein [Sphingomicrobium astaxanthinifaciens]|uniref:glycoside hydrolase family 15 protein n=1 Tax=Sphingomicrobium astaxanthinifaciens TaxID=1227949 RepID=UPI001FCC34B9|nr:glycoside hydrolase family 15 protein [Sphingomicrobium astaxanthinifaciens]MCJ7420207.1 glycoside hydrolase family 15 protein [Sphingomicrobium astaxanthinifaciens]